MGSRIKFKDSLLLKFHHTDIKGGGNEKGRYFTIWSIWQEDKSLDFLSTMEKGRAAAQWNQPQGRSNFTSYGILLSDICSLAKIACKKKSAGNNGIIDNMEKSYWREESPEEMPQKWTKIYSKRLLGFIPYSSFRFFSFVKASSWIDRMALFPRFLQKVKHLF